MTAARQLSYRRDSLSRSGGFLLAGLLLMAGTAAAEVVLSTQVQRVVDIDRGSGVGMETLEAVTDVTTGDVVRYTILFQNDSDQDVAAGSVVITNPLPDGTVYVDGSATGQDTTITFSVDGIEFADPDQLLDASGTRAASATDYRSIRWTYQRRLPAGASGQVTFDVRML